MKKTRRYPRLQLDATALERAAAALLEQMSEEQSRQVESRLEVDLEHERWEHDLDTEFFADCARGARSYRFEKRAGPFGMGVEASSAGSTAWVAAPTRERARATQPMRRKRGRGRSKP